MSQHEPGVNRHQLRAWLKLAIESGLLERVPPQYVPEEPGEPEPTDGYARRLLAELKDPDSSTRMLREILADARRFRDWVEFRQKVSRRIILTGGRTDGGEAVALMRPSATRVPRERNTHRTDRGGVDPKSDPMWDDWLDG
jgi:transposase-like protein